MSSHPFSSFSAWIVIVRIFLRDGNQLSVINFKLLLTGWVRERIAKPLGDFKWRWMMIYDDSCCEGNE